MRRRPTTTDGRLKPVTIRSDGAPARWPFRLRKLREPRRRGSSFGVRLRAIAGPMLPRTIVAHHRRQVSCLVAPSGLGARLGQADARNVPVISLLIGSPRVSRHRAVASGRRLITHGVNAPILRLVLGHDSAVERFGDSAKDVIVLPRVRQIGNMATDVTPDP